MRKRKPVRRGKVPKKKASGGFTIKSLSQLKAEKAKRKAEELAAAQSQTEKEATASKPDVTAEKKLIEGAAAPAPRIRSLRKVTAPPTSTTAVAFDEELLRARIKKKRQRKLSPLRKSPRRSPAIPSSSPPPGTSTSTVSTTTASAADTTGTTSEIKSPPAATQKSVSELEEKRKAAENAAELEAKAALALRTTLEAKKREDERKKKEAEELKKNEASDLKKGEDLFQSLMDLVKGRTDADDITKEDYFVAGTWLLEELAGDIDDMKKTIEDEMKAKEAEETKALAAKKIQAEAEKRRKDEDARREEAEAAKAKAATAKAAKARAEKLKADKLTAAKARAEKLEAAKAAEAKAARLKAAKARADKLKAAKAAEAKAAEDKARAAATAVAKAKLKKEAEEKKKAQLSKQKTPSVSKTATPTSAAAAPNAGGAKRKSNQTTIKLIDRTPVVLTSAGKKTMDPKKDRAVKTRKFKIVDRNVIPIKAKKVKINARTPLINRNPTSTPIMTPPVAKKTIGSAALKPNRAARPFQMSVSRKRPSIVFSDAKLAGVLKKAEEAMEDCKKWLVEKFGVKDIEGTCSQMDLKCAQNGYYNDTEGYIQKEIQRWKPIAKVSHLIDDCERSEQGYHAGCGI
eukprot:CAMPEP_0167803866 /NCGR_PEP_ID=MMETSP0111_2-20121227/20119_1 /TAXON_ID=91324 /ORGANISM="Lotharella globosa, Strain CCCM811" /LENGTH=629 /DNA_ID=CAMNT_0007700473 /DNA_START=17 /DNA_END=1906 /DNA_ORIENTATION=-